MTSELSRGAIAWCDFGDPIGREQGLRRPALVVSARIKNNLVIVCPITSRRRAYPTRVEIAPGQSGLRQISYVQTEQIRTVSGERLGAVLGSADASTQAAVDGRLRILLGLT